VTEHAGWIREVHPDKATDDRVESVISGEVTEIALP
jgi:hypothetical protein